MRRTFLPRAFTLIELLVVITIIVILLAMLTPSLDRAIYQAELVTCAANLDAVASGAIAYAQDNKRNYPYRERGRGMNWILSQLYDGNPTRRGDESDPVNPQDTRRAVADYISSRAFVDPLCEELDLDPDFTDDDSICFSSNIHLWGLALTPPFAGTLRGMYKIGDRLHWNYDYGTGNGIEKYKFNILSSDFITRSVASDPESQGSHPDKDGVWSAHRLQNTNHNNTFLGVPMSQNANMSIWRNAGHSMHGRVDLNTGYSDGSVQRVVDVEPADATIEMQGPVIPVPGFTNGGFFPNIVTYLVKP